MQDIVNYRDITPKYSEGFLIGYDESIDEVAIRNSLKNLFSINQGEVPGKPWLGNPLNVFLFDNIDNFQNDAIKSAFINIIEKYEPRVEVFDVKVVVDPEYNSIVINLFYINLIGDKNKKINYRFSLNYNNLSNINLREI